VAANRWPGRDSADLSSWRALRSGLLGACLIAICACLSETAVAKTWSRPTRPVILSLAYRRFRPIAAPRSFYGLRVIAKQPHGQIIEVDYQEIDKRGGAHGVGGDATARYGLGGRRDGRLEVFYLLVATKLAAGMHRIRVIVYGSPGKHASVRSSSRIFVLHVVRSKRA